MSSTLGESGLAFIPPSASQVSVARAEELRSRTERRAAIPLRATFVRNDDPSIEPPLAALVRSGGRGAAVPLKLYLGLVWMGSGPPFDLPPLTARVWAELLDLEDPSGRGRKRVTAALNKLERHRLIAVNRSRGDASAVRLLLEDGSGSAYTEIPSTAYHREGGGEGKRYLKVNTRLWTNGHVQALSAKALAMLLVILEEQYGQSKPIWFSEARFQERFNLSKATRSEGARELFQRQLIMIKRAPVTNTGAAFERERSRNTYQVINDAVPSD